MIVWLSSYPRSGNTLVRTILHQSFGLVTYSKYNDETDIGADPRIAAQVGHESFAGGWPEVYSRFRRSKNLYIVKTHDAPEDSAPAIVVVRHGWTSTDSNRHYLKDFSGIDAPLDDVITGQAGQFPSWGRFLDLWDPENRPRTLLLKYEDLLADPAKAINQLAAFLKRDVQAKWQNNFREMQRLNPRFFRQGRTTITQQQFGATHAKLFAQLHGDWMVRLGYSPAASAPPQASRALREALAVGVERQSERWRAQLDHLTAVSRDQTAYIATMEKERNARANEAQRHINNLKTQVDQLAATSRQQDTYIATLVKERDRVAAEAKTAKVQGDRIAREGQKHIDAQQAQLDRLAATSRQQDAYIATLEKERDRSAAEGKAARTQAERTAREAQKHIDGLKAQLDRLAATSRQQDEYLATLRKELDRFEKSNAQLTTQCAHYVKVINDQTAFIGLLKQEHKQGTRGSGPA